MGDHDDSVAKRMNFLELFHNDVTVATIEVAGWLVGKDNARVCDKTTCNCDALLLAARKLVWHIVFTFA